MSVPLSDTRLTEIRERYTHPHGAEAIANGHVDAAVLLSEVDRLRAENAGLDDLRLRAIDKNDQLCKELAEYKRRVEYFDEQSKRRKTERDEARAQVRAASTVKCWTNEDGRRFVFAEDLAFALGYTPTTGQLVNDGQPMADAEIEAVEYGQRALGAGQ